MKYATIEDMTRIDGSVNGNPNYAFVLHESENDDAHEALSGQGCIWIARRTKSDISDSYGIIPNDCKKGKTIAFTITKSGRINSVKQVI